MRVEFIVVDSTDESIGMVGYSYELSEHDLAHLRDTMMNDKSWFHTKDGRGHHISVNLRTVTKIVYHT